MDYIMDHRLFSLAANKGNQVDRDLVFFTSLSVSTVHILLLTLPQHINGLLSTFPMDGFAPSFAQ